MGVFEWIGEAIGNACSAIAEFFGSVFEGIISFFGGFVKDIGKDTLGGIVVDVFDEESTAQDDMETIEDVVTAPITEGWDHLMKIMDKKHSATTPEQGYEDTMELWNAAKTELGIVAMLTTLIEALSFGQIDGASDITRVADTTRGLSTFTNSASMIKLEAQYLTPYQRYLNKLYPNVIPGPTDLIRMQLREVFHPDYRPELLLPPPSGTFTTAMLEHGYDKYWSDSYWAAHWVLPSLGELDEMLHRRIIEESDWEIMLRRNDYLPAWIENRKKIIYSPYTRVDARRMWDLRMLSKEEVYENYRDLGYDEAHAERMRDWTLVYVAAGDIRARYSKGWITAAEARTELLRAGMPVDRVDVYLEKLVKETETDRTSAERDLTKTDITRSVKKGILTKEQGVERLMDMGYSEDEASFIVDITVSEGISEEIEADRNLSKADTVKGVADGVFTYSQGIEMLMKLGYDETEAKYILEIRVPPKKPEKLKPERDLTKAEIVKGVKKEIITWDQGAIMLVDMGYDSDEADFILAINVEALAGSPETWSAMQDIVNKGRKAQGLEVKEIPRGIRELEGKLKELHQVEIKAKEEGETKDFFVALEKQRGPMKRQHRHLVEQYQKGG